MYLYDEFTRLRGLIVRLRISKFDEEYENMIVRCIYGGVKNAVFNPHEGDAFGEVYMLSKNDPLFIGTEIPADVLEIDNEVKKRRLKRAEALYRLRKLDLAKEITAKISQEQSDAIATMIMTLSFEKSKVAQHAETEDGKGLEQTHVDIIVNNKGRALNTLAAVDTSILSNESQFDNSGAQEYSTLPSHEETSSLNSGKAQDVKAGPPRIGYQQAAPERSQGENDGNMLELSPRPAPVTPGNMMASPLVSAGSHSTLSTPALRRSPESMNAINERDPAYRLVLERLRVVSGTGRGVSDESRQES